MLNLRRHPIWMLETRRRALFRLPGVVYNAATGVLFFLLLCTVTVAFVHDAVYALQAATLVYGVLYTAIALCVPIALGFDVVATWCKHQRLGVLLSLPQSRQNLITGMYVTSVWKSAEVVLGFGVPLAIPTAVALIVGEWSLRGVMAVTSAGCSLLLLLAAWGVFLGLRTRGQEKRLGGHMLAGLGCYAAAGWALHGPIVALQAWWSSITGADVADLFSRTPTDVAGLLFWWTLVHGLSAVVLVCFSAHMGWHYLVTPDRGNPLFSPRVRVVRVRYRKPPWLRGPFAADAMNRLSRQWRRNPLPLLGNVVLLYFLALVTDGSWFTYIQQACIFLVWGLWKGTRVARRDTQPGRMELLVCTGLSTSRILVGQWISALIALRFAMVFYWILKVVDAMQSIGSCTWHVDPLREAVSILLAAVLPLAVGAGVGVVTSHRLVVCWPRATED